MAAIVTELPPAGEPQGSSSFDAISVSASTLFPVYTPKVVSKMLVQVSIVTCSEVAAVNEYQTEVSQAASGFVGPVQPVLTLTPAWFGSPAWPVAATLVPATFWPDVTTVPGKLSFAGAAALAWPPEANTPTAVTAQANTVRRNLKAIAAVSAES